MATEALIRPVAIHDKFGVESPRERPCTCLDAAAHGNPGVFDNHFDETKQPNNRDIRSEWSHTWFPVFVALMPY